MRKGDFETVVSRKFTIVQMLPDLITGGVERGTLETGAFLVSKGHRSIVVSNGGPMVKDLVKNGSEHITLPVGEKNPKALWCIPQLRKMFIEEKVDILHLRSRLPAWMGLAAAKTINKKIRPRIVTTFHGFHSINAYSAVMIKGERVIAVSKPINEHIAEKYGVSGDHVRTINRGFDALSFDPKLVSQTRIYDLKTKWGLENKTGPFIMLPGRFTQLKGHGLFLSALEKIKHLSWTAVLVGDESEKPGYASLLKDQVLQAGLEGRVIFAGHCNDMPAAFMLSDLTISSSIRPESFGRVAVESQAMGIPVVATAHGGSLETVIPEKTGWLFPPTDVDALANVLEEAVGDPEKLQRMGSQAKKWVYSNFTTQLMCEKTLNLYEELLASPRIG